MSASSLTDYYEYNPVWFGTGQWQYDALTVVESSVDGKSVMITMEVVAQFFLRDFEATDLGGNVFLEFVSSKAKNWSNVRIIWIHTRVNCCQNAETELSE